MLPQNTQTQELNILKNPVTIIVFILSLTLVIVNIIIFGRNDMQTVFINTIFNPILAFVDSILTIFLIRQAKASPRARALWFGLFLGWACWAVAEAIWTIAFLRGQEVPYPSWADIFWCVGYIPMFVSLSIRARVSTEKPSLRRRIFLMVVVIAILVFTVFAILIPIIQAADPSLILESALNLFYPLADTVLILLSLRILYTVPKGIFSTGWTWISLGFILSSISDLFFTHLAGLDQYYPDSQANLLSVFLVDVPYTISYLIFIIGLVTLLMIKQSPTKIVKPGQTIPR